MFDTVYNTFLYTLYERGYNQRVGLYILLGYVSTRAINIFSVLSPDKVISVPLNELPLRFPIEEFKVINNRILENTSLKIIYGELMLPLDKILSPDVIATLEHMGIKKFKIPIYFAHKVPDFLSTYSEIYIGFTLKPPCKIIPLINNCEEYYNDNLLKTIKTIEDIEDITRDAPCPRPPYK
jgi:hypothetical protein